MSSTTRRPIPAGGYQVSRIPILGPLQSSCHVLRECRYIRPDTGIYDLAGDVVSGRGLLCLLRVFVIYVLRRLGLDRGLRGSLSWSMLGHGEDSTGSQGNGRRGIECVVLDGVA